MAANVKLQMEAEGINEVIRALDKIPKSLQKQVLAGSAVGKEFDKMARKAGQSSAVVKKSFKKQEDAINNVTKTLKSMVAGYIGLQGAAKVIEAVNMQIEKQLKFLRDVGIEVKKLRGETFGAKGNFINNFGNLNPNTVTGLQGAVRRQGLNAGVNFGDILTSFTQVKSGTTGVDVSSAMLIESFEQSLKAQRIDSKVDLGAQTIILVKLLAALQKQDPNVKASDANAFLSEIAKNTDLDANEIARPLAKVLSTEAFDVSPSQSGFLLARGTDITQTSGTTTAESISRLALRLTDPRSDKGFKLGREKFEFKSERAGDRIFEFIKILSDNNASAKQILSALKQLGIGEQNDIKLITGAVLEARGGDFFGKFGRVQAAAEAGQKDPLDIKLQNLKNQGALDFQQSEIERRERAETDFAKQQNLNASQREGVLQSGFDTLVRLGISDPAQTGFTGLPTNLLGGINPDFSKRLQLMQKDLDANTDLTDEQRRQQLKNQSFALGLAFASDVNAPFLGSVQSNVFQEQRGRIGQLPIEAQSRFALRAGLVDPLDGLQQFEQAILREAGASEDIILRLQELKAEGGQVKLIQDLFDQLKLDLGIGQTLSQESANQFPSVFGVDAGAVALEKSLIITIEENTRATKAQSESIKQFLQDTKVKEKE